MVRMIADTPINANEGFGATLRISPAQTPIIPMMPAMKGVHAPGSIAASEITIMDAPATKPGTMPNA